MGQFEKMYAKFQRKPIPNDITFEELEVIASHFGCIVKSGGKHSKKIIYPPLGVVIPIPMHGKTVKEAYIKEVKELLSQIEEGNNEI